MSEARKEAERRWREPRYDHDPIAMFTQGAEWADMQRGAADLIGSGELVDITLETSGQAIELMKKYRAERDSAEAKIARVKKVIAQRGGTDINIVNRILDVLDTDQEASG